jgi:hypothetical protein
MATPSKKHLAALDPQFVLFLEAGAEDCQTVFDGLEKWKFNFIITDTALQELQETSESGCRPEIKLLANRLLPRLRGHYGIKTDGLPNYQYGCAEVIANHLLEKCLPPETSKNDALLIAEASVHECTFLIFLQDTKRFDNQRINLFIVEKGGNPITIYCTADILKENIGQLFGEK